MSRKGVKGKQSGANEDIISNLPVDVTAYILGKIPIREAIRTSVLSKKWRFNYLHIQQLVFNDQFWKELDDFFDDKIIRSDVLRCCLFDEVITKSLVLHPGGIESFKVCLNDLDEMVPYVNKWILYLSQRNIKKLSLKYEAIDAADELFHKLPPYFFSCLDLTSLKLQGFILSPPVEFKGFHNLYQLVLSDVEFTNKCFESFISSCPLLEKLVLDRCFGIHRFNISGSKLKRLFITTDNFEGISLLNAPNLTEVSIMLKRAIRKGLFCWNKSMGTLPKVELLRLNNNFLQLYAPLTLPYSLRILEFKGVNFMNLSEVENVLLLLKTAPNLQELYIEASTVEFCEEHVSRFLRTMDISDFPFPSLRLAKLTGVSSPCSRPQLEFIRFLVFSAPLLETMSIVEHPQLKAEDALDIARKLLRLKAPSSVSVDFSRERKK